MYEVGDVLIYKYGSFPVYIITEEVSPGVWRLAKIRTQHYDQQDAQGIARSYHTLREFIGLYGQKDALKFYKFLKKKNQLIFDTLDYFEDSFTELGIDYDK